MGVQSIPEHFRAVPGSDVERLLEEINVGTERIRGKKDASQHKITIICTITEVHSEGHVREKYFSCSLMLFKKT